MSSTGKYSAYTKFLIYLVVIVLVNVAGQTLFLRIDLTQNEIYSLSDASKKVASTLSEPLTINVFFTKNLPAPYNNTERYLHDLLEEYAIHGNKFFNYRFYNVSPEAEGDSISESAAENRKLANNYGIRPVQIQAIEKDEVKFKKAYMGLVILHGDMVERIPTITSINGLEYNLTMAIQKLNNKISALLGLDDKIKINLILSSSLKKMAPFMGLKELPDYPEKLKAIIDTLNAKTYDKLDFRHIDPTTDQSQESAYKDLNLMRLKWPAFPKDNIEAGNGVAGLVVSYGDRVREIPILRVMQLPLIGTQYDLTAIDQLEEIINDNIETLIDINEDLGYLVDHGTLPISLYPTPGQRQPPDTLTTFPGLVSRNYTLKPVALKNGAIPDSLKCLIIARPTEPFSDYELYQIDQALMRGTNLALFAEAFKAEPQNPRQPQGMNAGQVFAPFDTGLEKLLDHYGIRIKKSIVMDKNSHRQRLPQNMGGGEMQIFFVPLIKSKNINQTLDFMKPIKGLVTVRISPLELETERLSKQGITAHKLFSSSQQSWEARDRVNLNPMFLNPPPSDTEMQSFPLAYLLDGKFASYFDGKAMPEKPSEEKKPGENKSEDKKDGKPEESGKPAGAAEKKPDVDLSKIEQKGSFRPKSGGGKILLLSSSEMLADNLLDPSSSNPNSMFILNVLDALNQQQDIADMRSKEQRFNPLGETSGFAKTFIKTFNIAGLSVLVVIFGLFVWMRRHSRKKQIQMMFQK